LQVWVWDWQTPQKEELTVDVPATLTPLTE
jgi:hypothetical protein